MDTFPSTHHHRRTGPCRHRPHCPPRTLIRAAASWQRRGPLSAPWCSGAHYSPSTPGVDGDVVLGTTNTSASITTIYCTGASLSALDLVCPNGSNSFGLWTVASGIAIQGQQNGSGSTIRHRRGRGRHQLSISGHWSRRRQLRVDWLRRRRPGPEHTQHDRRWRRRGRKGERRSRTDHGGNNQNGIAIYGLNNSTYAGPGPGAGGFGVYGLSAKGHGLVGATSSAGAAAVVGATNGVAGAYAAAFYGPVIVGGDFTVFPAPRARRYPWPTVRIGAWTVSRVPRAGSRISARASSSVAKRTSQSIRCSPPSPTSRTITSS